MKSSIKTFLFLFTSLSTSKCVLAQTFFQPAEGDGVIAMRNKTISQIKVNLTSTAITYGFYYLSRHAMGDAGGFILNTELKAKPNTEGFATLVNTGKFQPGASINAAIGYRFNNVGHTWNVIDIYFKPSFSYDSYSIYDTTRKGVGEILSIKVTSGRFKIV